MLISSNLGVGWYLIGNLFIGGVLGWLIIDPASGAMWTLAPDKVMGSLKSSATAGNSRSDLNLRIVLKQSIDPFTFASLPLVRVN